MDHSDNAQEAVKSLQQSFKSIHDPKNENIILNLASGEQIESSERKQEKKNKIVKNSISLANENIQSKENSQHNNNQNDDIFNAFTEREDENLNQQIRKYDINRKSIQLENRDPKDLDLTDQQLQSIFMQTQSKNQAANEDKFMMKQFDNELQLQSISNSRNNHRYQDNILLENTNDMIGSRNSQHSIHQAFNQLNEKQVTTIETFENTDELNQTLLSNDEEQNRETINNQEKYNEKTQLQQRLNIQDDFQMSDTFLRAENQLSHYNQSNMSQNILKVNNEMYLSGDLLFRNQQQTHAQIGTLSQSIFSSQEKPSISSRKLSQIQRLTSKEIQSNQYDSSMHLNTIQEKSLQRIFSFYAKQSYSKLIGHNPTFQNIEMHLNIMDYASFNKFFHDFEIDKQQFFDKQQLIKQFKQESIQNGSALQIGYKSFQKILYFLFDKKLKNKKIFSPNKYTLYENNQIIWNDISQQFHLNQPNLMEYKLNGFLNPFDSNDYKKRKAFVKRIQQIQIKSDQKELKYTDETPKFSQLQVTLWKKNEHENLELMNYSRTDAKSQDQISKNNSSSFMKIQQNSLQKSFNDQITEINQQGFKSWFNLSTKQKKILRQFIKVQKLKKEMKQKNRINYQDQLRLDQKLKNEEFLLQQAKLAYPGMLEQLIKQLKLKFAKLDQQGRKIKQSKQNPLLEDEPSFENSSLNKTSRESLNYVDESKSEENVQQISISQNQSQNFTLIQLNQFSDYTQMKETFEENDEFDEIEEIKKYIQEYTQHSQFSQESDKRSSIFDFNGTFRGMHNHQNINMQSIQYPQSITAQETPKQINVHDKYQTQSILIDKHDKILNNSQHYQQNHNKAPRQNIEISENPYQESKNAVNFQSVFNSSRQSMQSAKWGSSEDNYQLNLSNQNKKTNLTSQSITQYQQQEKNIYGLQDDQKYNYQIQTQYQNQQMFDISGDQQMNSQNSTKYNAQNPQQKSQKGIQKLKKSQKKLNESRSNTNVRSQNLQTQKSGNIQINRTGRNNQSLQRNRTDQYDLQNYNIKQQSLIQENVYQNNSPPNQNYNQDHKQQNQIDQNIYYNQNQIINQSYQNEPELQASIDYNYHMQTQIEKLPQISRQTQNNYTKQNLIDQIQKQILAKKLMKKGQGMNSANNVFQNHENLLEYQKRVLLKMNKDQKQTSPVDQKPYQQPVLHIQQQLYQNQDINEIEQQNYIQSQNEAQRMNNQIKVLQRNTQVNQNQKQTVKIIQKSPSKRLLPSLNQQLSQQRSKNRQNIDSRINTNNFLQN